LEIEVGKTGLTDCRIIIVGGPTRVRASAGIGLGNESHPILHSGTGFDMFRRKERAPRSVGLIVAADEPALIFSSPSVAEGYLEATDVRNGTYPAAYGPRGEPYEIKVSDNEEVKIQMKDGCPRDAEGLRELVETFLRSYGIPVSEDISLEEIVKLCEPYVDDGI
jgi:hypothetical protein